MMINKRLSPFKRLLQCVVLRTELHTVKQKGGGSRRSIWSQLAFAEVHPWMDAPVAGTDPTSFPSTAEPEDLVSLQRHADPVTPPRQHERRTPATLSVISGSASHRLPGEKRGSLHLPLPPQTPPPHRSEHSCSPPTPPPPTAQKHF